jgi:hypothetical protein
MEWDSTTDVTTFVTPAITNVQILPETKISPFFQSSNTFLKGSPGEYRAVTFTVHTDSGISSLSLEVTDFTSDRDVINKSAIDIKVVKCWYQNTREASGVRTKHLVPELLLRDDSLVKVEDNENYIRTASGEYVWISDPKGVSANITDIKDASVLQPVEIPGGQNKQFWVTVHIPDTQKPGSYTGYVYLKTGRKYVKRIQIEIEVLAIELLRPKMKYSLYYLGRLLDDSIEIGNSLGRTRKTEAALRADLQNIIEHGTDNIVIFGQGIDWERKLNWNEALFRRFLTIMKEVGMLNGPLYYGGLGYWESPSLESVQSVLKVAQDYKVSKLYIYGIDEAKGYELKAQRPFWDKLHSLGVGALSACSSGSFNLVGDILDIVNYWGPPSKTEAALWHSTGKEIFCYYNPQSGEENPLIYRRNYGLVLWQNDYDGAMCYAYQDSLGSIWNDFDSPGEHDETFTYPVKDGVIDTIAWEGWREGTNDSRYLNTLIDKLKLNAAIGRDTTDIETWLAALKEKDITSTNLDAIREQLISNIIELQNNLNGSPSPG